MSTSQVVRARFPRLIPSMKRPVGWFGTIGDHVLFYGRALGGVPHAAVHFRKECIRLIAEIAMGAGTLAMIKAFRGVLRFFRAETYAGAPGSACTATTSAWLLSCCRTCATTDTGCEGSRT